MRKQLIIMGAAMALWVLMVIPGQAAVVTQLNITGGSVGFNVALGNTSVPLFSGTFTQNGTLLMGQYQAANGPTPVLPPSMLIGGETFTLLTNPGNGAPLPAPSGETTGNTINVNLNSLFANISGPLINGGLNIGNQLPAFATGTFNEQTGAFHLAWDHVYSLPADFVGIGSFALDGNAAVVPLPAAAWLFGSGLAGLYGLVRRRWPSGA